MTTGLLSVDEAQARAIAVAPHPTVERVGLWDARGRVLAEEVHARADVPPHDNSAMDGFAVRAGDGLELEIIGEVAAGHVAPTPLAGGQAYRIMTGAPIPPGADAVVMVEDTTVEGTRVRLGKAPAAGAHIRRAGEDLKAGQRVLGPGAVLAAAELGVLASLQRATVQVTRRPEVAVLVTGDELRDLHEPLGPGAIADSNSHTLAALVREAGGRPRVLPIVRDDPALIRRAIEDAGSADLIVSSGGVSVGEHDHVKAVLAELGATLELWRVNMKPGKPVAIARLGTTPFYGLPGNPVSSMIAFLLFVRPAIRAALGLVPLDLPLAQVIVEVPVRARGERRTYLRARLRFDAGELLARPMPQQGSHVLTSMLGANGLLVIEPGAAEVAAGGRMQALVIGPL